MKVKRYTFEEIENCEMCGDATAKHKIMGQRLNKSQGFNPKKIDGISVSVKKCTNCGLIYSSPQPVPFDIADHYGVPPESYWKPEYFKINPNYMDYEMNVAKRLMDVKPGMKGLDIGAGLGKCMVALDKAGFDAYGFEPSQPYYEKAISWMNISKEKLKLGMIEEIEYEAESFDFIIFGAVFEHLYHPAQSLEKAMSWLKPGGIIFIEVPSSRYLMQRLVNFYYRFRGSNYVSNISPMHMPFHLYEFSYKSFEAQADKLGYDIVFHEFHVANIVFPARFLHGILKKIMKWRKSGMQLAVWLKKR